MKCTFYGEVNYMRFMLKTIRWRHLCTFLQFHCHLKHSVRNIVLLFVFWRQKDLAQMLLCLICIWHIVTRPVIHVSCGKFVHGWESFVDNEWSSQHRCQLFWWAIQYHSQMILSCCLISVLMNFDDSWKTKH